MQFVLAILLVTLSVCSQAIASEPCNILYKKYLDAPNVYMAFATTNGDAPKDNGAPDFACGLAGRATLEDTKKAAVAECEAAAKRSSAQNKCKLFKLKSRKSKLAKNDCSVVEAWYRKPHPGFTVMATTSGKPIDSTEVMACTAQFAPRLSAAKNIALKECNKQSRLRGLPANCKIIASKRR